MGGGSKDDNPQEIHRTGGGRGRVVEDDTETTRLEKYSAPSKTLQRRGGGGEDAAHRPTSPEKYTEPRTGGGGGQGGWSHIGDSPEKSAQKRHGWQRSEDPRAKNS